MTADMRDGYDNADSTHAGFCDGAPSRTAPLFLIVV
jgi:hypothetical protein